MLQGPNEANNLAMAKNLADKFKQFGADIIEVKGKFNTPDEAIKQVEITYKEAESKHQRTGKPIMIFLDKLESVALDLRNKKNQTAYINSTNQMKLLTENSSKKGIYWIFTTSRLNEIDQVVKRSGRIDQVIPVV